jgi:hypothetical protein
MEGNLQRRPQTNKKEFPEEPMETDEIWPQVEGGPKEHWNQRRIPRSQNRRKGPEMPDLDDVFESIAPARLAAEIDKRSLSGPFKHYRNKDKGFGGLPRYKLW